MLERHMNEKPRPKPRAPTAEPPPALPSLDIAVTEGVTSNGREAGGQLDRRQ